MQHLKNYQTDYLSSFRKKIHNFLFTFKNNALESSFQSWSYHERYKLFSIAVYIGGFTTVLFIIPDFLHLGYGQELIASALSRIFIFTIAILMLFLIKNQRSPIFLDVAMLITAISIVIASGIIIKNTAGHPAIAGLSEMLTVLIFYVFLPQRLIFSIATGFFASIVFLSIRFFSSDIEVDVLTALLFSYTLANIFGFIYARTRNFTRRFEYYVISNEKNLRESLQSEIIKREKLEQELRELSTIDSLTGLYNRRFFETYTANLINQCNRFDEIFSIILVDIDNFKNINDNLGHQEGDAVLVNIARLFREHTRRSEVISRFGGEEFVILCPHHELDSVQILAEKLRLLVETAPLSNKTEVTISSGVSTYQPGKSIDDLFRESDEALYRAKTTGKNKVCV